MKIFRQDVPSSPVAEGVKAFWQVVRNNEEFNRETIIPKGSVEVIFNLYETHPVFAKIGTQDSMVPRCFISAYNTVPIHLQIPKQQAFFGVFLNPTVLPKLFGLAAHEYANDCVDLTLIDKSMATLWHHLGEEKSFENRVKIFSSWLGKRITESSPREKLLDDFLTSTRGQVSSAKGLSDLLCYSPRHLSRKLYDVTGMNLEQNLMYKKYLRAISLMHWSTHSLTAIAHACDFTDQPHFSKTFRSYSGMKPSDYRAMKSSISGHIFEYVR